MGLSTSRFDNTFPPELAKPTPQEKLSTSKLHLDYSYIWCAVNLYYDFRRSHQNLRINGESINTIKDDKLIYAVTLIYNKLAEGEKSPTKEALFSGIPPMLLCINEIFANLSPDLPFYGGDDKQIWNSYRRVLGDSYITNGVISEIGIKAFAFCFLRDFFTALGSSLESKDVEHYYNITKNANAVMTYDGGSYDLKHHDIEKFTVGGIIAIVVVVIVMGIIGFYVGGSLLFPEAFKGTTAARRAMAADF